MGGPSLAVGQTDPVAAALASRGGAWVDLPVLLSAGLVLELSGEALRSRLFFASGVDGQELCLRPDLTVPAAQAVAAQPLNGPTVWLQAGKVFRAPNPGEAAPIEFIQIGLERFADADSIQADADVVLAALEACAKGGLSAPALTISDAALLHLLLTGAALPAPWGEVLEREAFRPDALRRRLKEAAAPDASGIGALEQGLAGMGQDGARAAVAEILALSRLNTGATRTTDQIADRLAEKARRALAPALPAIIVEALQMALSASGPLLPTLDGLVSSAATIGVDLAGWRQDWARRLDLIAVHAPKAVAEAGFNMGKARNFGYYDGMNFDIARDHTSRPAASGGRYDRLVEKLGGAPTAAVGCVIRPERLGTISGGGW
jgi:ATP phosphoribosyltransferase regulatory subunit